MKKPRPSISARHRFPAEVISLAVWLDVRLPLSVQMVVAMRAGRGIETSHETVRRWAERLGRVCQAHPPTRTPDEALQGGATGAALFLNP